jgi:hypothetical protein
MNAKHVKIGRFLMTTSAALGVCLAGRDAGATLGGDVASVEANHVHLGGERTVQKLQSGERHDLVLPSGIVVREYVGPGGAVYGIAWSGPRMPDLRELLGGYFDQLGQGDVHARGGLHRMSISGTDFVVRSSGHQGSFAGRAWVPSLVPPGIDPAASLEESGAK